MPSSIVPLFVGATLVVVGILLIVFRRAVARANRDGQRVVFGRLANNTAKKATPGNTLFVGVGAIVIGVILFWTNSGAIR